jgi:tetratricopeptide (TPR) repeat protein
MVLSGIVPPLADPYYPRHETIPELAPALRPGEVTVLTHGDGPGAAPVTQGGTGKTQLAVAVAHALWQAGAVEVLAWVTAASREALVTGFAEAATVVGASDPGSGADAAAASFITWLANTARPWAVILDDLAQPADLDGLWPAGPAGQALITTRLPAGAVTAAVERGAAAGPAPPPRNLRFVPVSSFSRREALGYLTTRLTDYPDQRIEALDLGEDLAGLPLGLTQAAAVMLARELGCREYRAMFAERRTAISVRAVDGVSASVLATWSLAAECAHELAPAGLAWPALALAATLDPHGIPGAVLTSPTACSYITGHPSTAGGSDQNLVRRAISNLARVGLVTIDPVTPVRTVRMHPSVRNAVLAYIPTAELEQVVLAAADALLETWPEDAGDAASSAQLDQVMRDCAAALREVDATPLWKPEAHPLLFRAGLSLEGSGHGGAAIAYWQAMVAKSTRLLGPAHANSVVARDRLALAYESAGRVADAIAVFASALADREHNLGPDHADTIAARGHLAHAYLNLGRATDAITILERTAADADRVFGPVSGATLTARAELAAVYSQASRHKEAIRRYQALVADTDRTLGAGHATTLAARAGLADAYQAAGQAKDAIEQLKRALSATEAVGGRDHADTVAARAALASALRRAGKLKDAISEYQLVLTSWERVQGPEHVDTLAARGNLAFALRSNGQLREALPLYEQTLAGMERAQGPDHHDTRTARVNLASAYQQIGRTGDAITQYERALADSERMLGPGDVETLTARCSLAASLFSAGRLMEVVTVLQRALADCERYLPADHPMINTVRNNLTAATTT